ncbi:uroporphyrinogen-III synthase, chloroplastic-like isoform X2 [Nicotiana sylvestris]|uniref:uroporphyrinogen-III synthase, chloroplastic-like isoform X2 n=1 Tax=Nicotiana sylvestris TaxID=4096 RepID=UPI00388CEB82
MSKYKFYNVAEVSPNTCLYTAAGTPFVRAGVVGSGTASIFDEVVQSSKQSKATGKVFAAERLQNGNDKCTVLCLASAKAGTDIEEGLAEQGFECACRFGYLVDGADCYYSRARKLLHQRPVQHSGKSRPYTFSSS